MALIRPETSAVWREIPHEPGQRVQIRPLTGVELDRACQATVDKAMASVTSLPPGMLEMFTARSGGGSQGPEPDPDVLIKHGLVGWTYEENGIAVPVNDETVALLDAKTRDWLADEIKALCVREPTEKKEYAAS